MNELNLTAKVFEVAPSALFPFFLNGIGWVLKQTNIVNSRFIPLILVILGAAMFPFVVEDGTLVWNSRVPEVYTAMIGAMMGMAAVGTHKVLFKKKEPSGKSMPDSANE